MPKDDGLYFAHMLDMARRAIGKTQGIGEDIYDGDENLRLALAHLVQVIGEAARRVSPEGRAAHPEIPWFEITGMRSKIVHDYSLNRFPFQEKEATHTRTFLLARSIHIGA